MMRDRLINSIQNSVQGCARNWAETIADYLLNEGWFKLPFKVGETVYDISDYIDYEYIDPEMYELKDSQLNIVKGIDGSYRYEYDGIDILPEDIGRIVFLSKEEAEKAVEKALADKSDVMRKEGDGK